VTVPREGAVLGIDVGYSDTKRSSSICKLEWSVTSVWWTVCHFRFRERVEKVGHVVGSGAILAAAFDGPFRGALDQINAYRPAEQMLTRRLDGLCKPGQSNSPVGKKLNAATNAFVTLILALRDCELAEAGHSCPVHDKAVVEAFPNAFLGLLIDDWRALGRARSKRSDCYYQHLDGEGRLDDLLRRLLPGRKPASSFGEVKNHDERAALTCALTALCVVAEEFVAVGDADHGWIILPPREMIRERNFARLKENSGELSAALLALPLLSSSGPKRAAPAIEEFVPCPQ
jgi:hypothetical protein